MLTSVDIISPHKAMKKAQFSPGSDDVIDMKHRTVAMKEMVKKFNS